MRDVPEFRPRVTFEEAIQAGVTGMEDRGEWKNSDEDTWEDEIIAAQREVVARLKKENN